MRLMNKQKKKGEKREGIFQTPDGGGLSAVRPATPSSPLQHEASCKKSLERKEKKKSNNNRGRIHICMIAGGGKKKQAFAKGSLV